jgi:hypothetical protein
MIRAKVEELDSGVYFHSAEFARLGAGYKLHYAFDHADLEAGCVIRNREEGARAKLRPATPSLHHSTTPFRAGEVIGRAEYVERVPQFSLAAADDPASRERRRRFVQQCRLMFRQVMPFGVGRAARVEERRDGRGNVQRVEISAQRSNAPTLQHSTLNGRPAAEADAQAKTATDAAAARLFSPEPGSPGSTAREAIRPQPPAIAASRAPLSRRPSRWELLETANP